MIYDMDFNEESVYYMESYARRKRQSLFNMYAFTFEDSYQKENSLESDHAMIADDYQIPTLNLENVEFRNFLSDY